MTAPRHGTGYYHWSQWPLNRLFAAVTAAVLLFLFLVLGLGLHQYLLYNQCRQAVRNGDGLLFQFTALKDHLDQSLIRGEAISLRAFTAEMQTLGREIEQLRGNVLIPEGLKSSLPNRTDLVGLEVRLRAVQEQRQDQAAEIAELVNGLNRTNVGLQEFHFQLSDHTRNILFGLHKIIIGALGLITVLALCLLYLLNRHLALPMLDLCRQLALPGEEIDAGGRFCSFAQLTGRIGELLSAAADCPDRLPAAAPAPTGPELEREACRLRHAALGAIAKDLASELTNRINGVINYTQTLIDLEDQGQGHGQREKLFQALVAEEKKTADLVIALQRAGRWPQRLGEGGVTLDTLLTMLNMVLDKPLRSEGIALSLPGQGRHQVGTAGGDLWLVLLSLLEQGRRALKEHSGADQGEKRLSVTLRQTVEDPDMLSLVLDNSAAAWIEDETDMVWPSRALCTLLLQRHQGSLTIETLPEGQRLRINLPCRTSAA